MSAAKIKVRLKSLLASREMDQLERSVLLLTENGPALIIMPGQSQTINQEFKCKNRIGY